MSAEVDRWREVCERRKWCRASESEVEDAGDALAARVMELELSLADIATTTIGARNSALVLVHKAMDALGMETA